MAAEKTTAVLGLDGEQTGQATIPDVFSVPLRRDLVQFVHTNMRKNARQAYGVQNHFGPMGIVAGHQHSAHSWGTGRAVSRIPRVSGGGTHRAGQAAFGNMCRGGRMFAPTKTYRRWHKKINKTQKQQAVSSCVAATAVTALVQGRGHKVEEVRQIPIVVSDEIQTLTRTADAVACLNSLGLEDELTKCKRKQSRPGKGKMRGRRHKMRRGPLVIYDEDEGLVRAFRNIPGVDLCKVDRLNLLQLAPGGHVGRLCVWSESAFKKMDKFLEGKKGLQVLMKNPDLNALINNDAIQDVLNDKKTTYTVQRKRNLLGNKKARYETFRGFSLEEVAQRKRKASSMNGKARKRFRQS